MLDCNIISSGMKKEDLEKIRIARIVKGYSQDYMAQQLEISQSQYSRLESGFSTISEIHLNAICSILGIEIIISSESS
ncbi:Helix-turn-helix domain protein [compost metagenome]